MCVGGWGGGGSPGYGFPKPPPYTPNIHTIYIQWALVYPTTSVHHKMCQINQVLDKSGVG